MKQTVPAASRYRSGQDGIVSWHCFSAGAHYDPENTSFGPIIGVDEHLVAPGAGFDWHGHRGVAIVSWVLSGRLHHEDGAGRVRLVGRGEALVQSTGTGIRHCEVNASAAEPLRLVQMTVLTADASSSLHVSAPPVEVGPARFDVWTGDRATDSARWHLFVGSGSWQLGDVDLGVGDSVRGTGSVAAAGQGELLVWLL